MNACIFVILFERDPTRFDKVGVVLNPSTNEVVLRERTAVGNHVTAGSGLISEKITEPKYQVS